MEAAKVFGELSLNDKIFYVTKDFYSTLGISGVKADEDNRGNTIVTFHNRDFEEVSFPNAECLYEDSELGIKYTTDKRTYQVWINPFITKKIATKQERIEEIKQEIEELRASIT